MITEKRFIEICKSYGLDRTDTGNDYDVVKYGRMGDFFLNHVMIWDNYVVHGYIKINEFASSKNQLVTTTDSISIYNETKLKYYIEQYLKNEKQYIKSCRRKKIEEL